MFFDGDVGGGGGFDSFLSALHHRLHILCREAAAQPTESEDYSFVMPIGLFLVVDEANGGNATAKELVKRFNLLHEESRTAIDFYFLGWEWSDATDHSKGIKFNLKSFERCRKILKDAGIHKFGGNADLILVDVRCKFKVIKRDLKNGMHTVGPIQEQFNFHEAIYVNLATSLSNKHIPSLGDFLQSIIDAAESLQSGAPRSRAVYSISDKLGIATAKRSLLGFFLKTWGAIIGADKLETLAVRDLGPDLDISELDFSAVPTPRGPN
jgi:hypothetical protein